MYSSNHYLTFLRSAKENDLDSNLVYRLYAYFLEPHSYAPLEVLEVLIARNLSLFEISRFTVYRLFTYSKEGTTYYDIYSYASHFNTLLPPAPPYAQHEDARGIYDDYLRAQCASLTEVLACRDLSFKWTLGIIDFKTNLTMLSS
ncbi:hypothetical protein QCA50_002572 [Cerrena zonata]|uniref:Uncharacterized protein n=1 Tax=Cerrena zonata TaxID=2478898 RepID=A0AAW0GK13_9APHY